MSTTAVVNASDQEDGGRAIVRDSLPALVEERRALPVPWDSWSGMVQFAQAAAESRVLPKHITNWQAALIIMQKALELQIPPVEGLTGIYMVEGRVTVSARLMAGMIYRAHGASALEVLETTAERCTIQYRRRGWPAPRTYTYTMEMATKARLAGKDNYTKYPDAMLRARCISAVASFAFPDVIGGLLTPEEMDAPVMVTAAGDVVIDMQALPARPTPPAKAPSLHGAALGHNLYAACIAALAHHGIVLEPLAPDQGPAAIDLALTGVLDDLANLADGPVPTTLTGATEKALEVARTTYAARDVQLALPISYGDAGGQALIAVLRKGLMASKKVQNESPVAEGGTGE